ncbi:MAG: GTPase Era [SAR324 cluster bacterium]|nr:GTPase Era [SAR324 cluster bacterium]
MQEQHCGFIGLIGRPNVGKSTLLNQIIGQKISITAHRPQTTRNRILGIRTIDDCQMIFIDTPGMHSSDKLLNQRIVNYALQTLQEADLNLLLVEPISHNKNRLHKEDVEIIKQLGNKVAQTVVAINKIDSVGPEAVLRTIAIFDKLETFAAVVPISALKTTNVEHLLETLQGYLPAGTFYFENDQITDASERFLVSEFVREELFRVLQQELPYAIAVEVDSFEETPNLVKIHCKIHVERDSQKGIVIGKNGKVLKQIGSAARHKIEYLLGRKVFLSLHVNVLKKWSSNPRHLDNLGLS